MLQRGRPAPAIGPDARTTRTADARARVRALLAHLSAADRRALGLWAGAHLALAVTAWISTWIAGQRGIYNNLIGTYGQWDGAWYQNIAAHGYFSGKSWGVAERVFLPGDPAVLAAVHLAVRNWTVAELLMSTIAGAVAVVSLRRLAGERAVLYLLAAPAAMYLMTGYSEPLFLAFALPAWIAARNRNWALAGTLAAYAGLIRANGLFLDAGLLVAALTTADAGRRLRATCWVCLSLLGPGVYEIYLRIGTGSWGAWMTANRSAWGLKACWPWTAWRGTWRLAFGSVLPPDRAAMFQVEIACMLAGVLLAALLAWRRQWPEATYVALMFLALGTTSYYQSIPRALLIAWPLYEMVAVAAERRPWIGQVYLWASVPLAVVVAVFFFTGKWGV